MPLPPDDLLDVCNWIVSCPCGRKRTVLMSRDRLRACTLRCSKCGRAQRSERKTARLAPRIRERFGDGRPVPEYPDANGGLIRATP